MVVIWNFAQTVHMAKKAKKQRRRDDPGHFIRQWRDHRDLTLEALAEMVGLTHGTLSRIERGKTAYTQPVLERLAEALQTTKASLLERDPSKPGSIWDLLEQVPQSERDNAAKALAGFTKRTGTDN